MTTKQDIEKRISNKPISPIFSIFMIENADKEIILPDGRRSGYPDFGYTYTAGYFYDLEDAVKAVTENAGDIRENCYDAAFILCLFPGLYQTAGPNERLYFIWNEEKKSFMQCEEPNFLSHIGL